MTVTTRIAYTVGRVLAVGFLSVLVSSAAIAVPVANATAAQCQDVGETIDSYLQRHPDLHQELQAKSRAEGGDGSAVDYLNRHPDVRAHLIELSHECVPEAPW